MSNPEFDSLQIDTKLLDGAYAALSSTAVAMRLNEDLIKPFVHSSAEIINGAGQLSNRLFGTCFLELKSQTPVPAAGGTVDWFAQKISGALPAIVPFFMARGTVRGLGQLCRIAGETAGLCSRGTAAAETIGLMTIPYARPGFMVAESGLSGALNDFVFHPVNDKEGEFWSARGKHAVIGGVTFAVQSGLSLAFLGRSAWHSIAQGNLPQTTWLKDVGVNLASGMPAGALNAELNARLFQHRDATLNEWATAAVDFGVVGAGLGLFHGWGKPKESTPSNSVIGNPEIMTPLPEGEVNNQNSDPQSSAAIHELTQMKPIPTPTTQLMDAIEVTPHSSFAQGSRKELSEHEHLIQAIEAFPVRPAQCGIDRSTLLDLPLTENTSTTNFSTRLSEYRREALPLLAPLKVANETINQMDHKSVAKLITHELDMEPVRVRIYGVEGHETKIIVEDILAEQLDRVRQFRHLSESPDWFASPKIAMDRFGVSEASRYLALPEDFIPGLDFLPDSRYLDKLVLRGQENPLDIVHRKLYAKDFVSSASVSDYNEVSFFRKQTDGHLPQEIAHEFAHLLEIRFPGLKDLYERVMKIEPISQISSSDYAKRNAPEDWAVHLGEYVLNADGVVFRQFCQQAPVRSTIFGNLLRTLMDNLPAENRTSYHDALERRIQFIEEHVRPQALEYLKSL